MPLNTAQKIRIAQLACDWVMLARRFTGRGHTATVKRGGVRWDLDLREGIDFSIYLLGAFERSTVKAYSRIVVPGSIVIDIGANIGAHTLFLGQLCGRTGRVIAFEPTHYAFTKLKRNVEINPDISSRISCHQIMLVASAGDTVAKEVYSSWPLRNSAPVELHADHKGRLIATAGATAETLDGALDRLGVHRVDFVKLDVDGHEAEVLEGAGRTFKRHHPAILMELAPFVFRDDMGRFAFMLEFFWKLGYQLTNVSGGTLLPRNTQKVVEMIPEKGGINVLGRAS
jgi:FkbM family methyltransferase